MPTPQRDVEPHSLRAVHRRQGALLACVQHAPSEAVRHLYDVHAERAPSHPAEWPQRTVRQLERRPKRPCEKPSGAGAFFRASI